MHLQFNINSIFEYQLNSVGVFCRANPRWISVHKLYFYVHGALALPTGRKGHTCWSGIRGSSDPKVARFLICRYLHNIPIIPNLPLMLWLTMLAHAGQSFIIAFAESRREICNLHNLYPSCNRFFDTMEAWLIFSITKLENITGFSCLDKITIKLNRTELKFVWF